MSFSNHTGYPSVAGTRLAPGNLAALLAGLAANGLAASYDYVLTGYVGSAATLGELRDALAAGWGAGGDEGGGGRGGRRPLVIIDPVMGDHDRWGRRGG